MHKKISKLISDTFYESSLEDDSNIDKLTISEPCLKHMAFQPMTFYDLESDEVFENNSFHKPQQIQLITELYKQLKTIYKTNEVKYKFNITN